MAVELMTAHHATCNVMEQLNQAKGELSEAKMRQQMRLCGSLDAQLQAAHAAIDAGASTAKEWAASAEQLLQTFASLLNGSCCLSGAITECWCHDQNCCTWKSALFLPDLMHVQVPMRWNS